ncbi:TRAP transporter small permease [Vibrio sp. SCSIO 43132]|uniref:TRAP transporter small permease n=1 Tax=Vibrio sp. SCSIO 43132 TaxID=2779363 RepID=UPI001CA86EB3|nr:TRAP transporter small permease [Vibrio sp. SCSIO 43132]UAB69400.1 TRAP transporter small permease [Vibrio sp. SCSIO 43132]
MMSLRKVSEVLGKLETALALIAMSLVLGSVVWGVITRYITEQPAVWTTELSGIAFTWMVFMGAAVCYRKSLHIGVPVFVDALPDNIRKRLFQLTTLVVLIFLAYSFYLATVLAFQSWNRPSPVLRLPFFFVYLATCLSFLFMLIHSVSHLFNRPTQTDDSSEPEVL